PVGERGRVLHLAERPAVEHPVAVAPPVLVGDPAVDREPPGKILERRREGAVREQPPGVVWIAGSDVVLVPAGAVAGRAALGQFTGGDTPGGREARRRECL